MKRPSHPHPHSVPSRKPNSNQTVNQSDQEAKVLTQSCQWTNDSRVAALVRREDMWAFLEYLNLVGLFLAIFFCVVFSFLLFWLGNLIYFGEHMLKNEWPWLFCLLIKSQVNICSQEIQLQIGPTHTRSHTHQHTVTHSLMMLPWDSLINGQKVRSIFWARTVGKSVNTHVTQAECVCEWEWVCVCVLWPLLSVHPKYKQAA